MTDQHTRHCSVVVVGLCDSSLCAASHRHAMIISNRLSVTNVGMKQRTKKNTHSYTVPLYARHPLIDGGVNKKVAYHRDTCGVTVSRLENSIRADRTGPTPSARERGYAHVRDTRFMCFCQRARACVCARTVSLEHEYIMFSNVAWCTGLRETQPALWRGGRSRPAIAATDSRTQTVRGLFAHILSKHIR